MILSIEVNHTDIQVELLPSSSSKALEELLKSGPLVIPMKDYAPHGENSEIWVSGFPAMTSTSLRRPEM